ncbi:MAG: SLC13 family permease, partial [Endomicrobiia bacterium]|nr:SLC13 family permease [Endomicrobiia bacterium]
LAAAAAGALLGLETRQVIIAAIFATSIFGTLFFWDFRLSFVFLGSGLLLTINAVELEDFLKYASLDVILFLIGMMIIVGMMKESGFFYWFVTTILRIKKLNGAKLFIGISVISAVLSGMMGEVTSIMIMVAVILDICLFFEIRPAPLIISSVMATNIGSAATLLGNPVGILIASRSKLSFEDFLMRGLPVSIVVLAATIGAMMLWFRRYIRELDEKLAAQSDNKGFFYLISIPPDRKTKISMMIFAATVLLMGFHKRIEGLVGVRENTLLMMLPVISAGIVMIYRHDRARHYIEREVEWQSLLFFMFLFAQAGVIQSSGIATLMAQKMLSLISDPGILAAAVLFSSGFLSSILDNVVVVASYVPIIRNMDIADKSILWWALLFGGCYGGNVTMVGSSANIVALGILEKKANVKVSFSEWLKIGVVVGTVSALISL